MTTNANGDGSLTPESASDTPVRAVDEDWEGLKRVRTASAKPDNGGKFSVDGVFSVLGVLAFIACWVVFGIIIFQYLTGIGAVVVLAILGAIIGGFIAAAVTFLLGMSGFSL